MGNLGSTLTLILMIFAVVLAILWILLPFAIFRIKDTQAKTAQAVDAIEAAVTHMARDIARLAEIQETEHRTRIIAKKAAAADST